MDHKRLLLALILSSVILFGRSHLFPPPTNEQQQNANTPRPPVSATATPATPAPPTPAGAPPLSSSPTAPDTPPQRLLKISTPLYQIEFGSRGATPKS